jgi:hypothetical protein
VSTTASTAAASSASFRTRIWGSDRKPFLVVDLCFDALNDAAHDTTCQGAAVLMVT